MKNILLLFVYLISTSSLIAQNDVTNLFDGKTLNGWKRVVGSGEYSVENNMIVGTTVAGSPNTFLTTEKNYGDFILEFDAKVDDTASNSGVQIRSHFNPDEINGKNKGRVYMRLSIIEDEAIFFIRGFIKLPGIGTRSPGVYLYRSSG